MGSKRSKSKKRSITNAGAPHNHTFFADISLGKRLPDKLRQEGHNVIGHLEKFAGDEKDEVWLTEAGQQGWVVLTKDKNIRSKEIEKHALMNARVHAFVLSSTDLNGDEISDAFEKAMPRIIHLLDAHKKPFIARVYKDGRAEIAYTQKQWKQEEKRRLKEDSP